MYWKSIRTHPLDLGATVAALGCSPLLFDVKVSQLSTRGLDNPDPVASGVVPIPMSSKLAPVENWRDVHQAEFIKLTDSSVSVIPMRG